MKKLVYLILINIGFFLNACSNQATLEDDFYFKEFKTGEEIILQNINGGEKTLVRAENGFVIKGEEEKILMLDFFGTFCTPCQEEAPILTNLWQKNNPNLILIGLSHFENVSDQAIKDFAITYGAYYFLSNSKENDRIIAQILKDINYKNMEQLPFKVILKDKKYQDLSNFWNTTQNFVKYYLGRIPEQIMQKDIDRISHESKK
ncbi:thioredoxin domain-containing protein [Campylobacter sp.]|uniref:thioredoxin domain-containing protein n=1 Tax=Campylobacter sp. TaxID=205 RepID=UPI0025B7B7FB|nr:thioredoxin domain-containing protein [Campylobacter sp.]